MIRLHGQRWPPLPCSNCSTIGAKEELVLYLISMPAPQPAAQENASSNAFSMMAALGAAAAAPGGPKKGTKPAPKKTPPDNAAEMNPVMLIHQMRPDISYDIEKVKGEDNRYTQVVSSMLDNMKFTGEASTVKEAKFILAKNALLNLFGVESTYEFVKKGAKPAA